MARRPFKARKSKLDAFTDIVGVEPDARVAARANVSTETVRSFRVRRGIPALWRGDQVGPKESRVVRPAARRTKKRGKRAFQGRRSRLDSYLDLLGTVPDAEVAAMAGVTAQNVRSFRMRRGIEAAWRGVAKPQPVAVPLLRPAALAVRAAKPVEVTRWAYRVTARVGAENREFVVLGESLSDAAIQAEGLLAERIPRARVLEIATLAEAL